MSYNISGIGNIKENVFITGDTLFDCKEAVNKLDRPWADEFDMTDDIIDKWNAKVKRRDIVYHLGNFGGKDKKRVSYILNKLNGRINLIVGEKDNSSNILSFRNKLASVNYRLDFTINRWKITLSSYPFRFWCDMDKGAWHLYSHLCGTIPPVPLTLSMDVGMDTNSYEPYHFDEIEDIMIQKHNYYNIQKEKLAHGVYL